jgi:hypothetical protein
MPTRTFPLCVAAALVALWGIKLTAEPPKPATDAPVKVEAADVAVEYKRFDPRKPPDPPPPLKPGEAAVCVYKFGVEVDARYSYRAPAPGAPRAAKDAPTRVDVKIEGVTARLSLGVTIWLPADATPALTAHEEAHRRIAEHYYATAGAVAKELASKLVGQQASGEGKDHQSAAKAAVDEVNQKLCKGYLDAVNDPCERAQEAFDRLTDHSRKPKPTADEAVKLAIREASARR